MSGQSAHVGRILPQNLPPPPQNPPPPPQTHYRIRYNSTSPPFAIPPLSHHLHTINWANRSYNFTLTPLPLNHHLYTSGVLPLPAPTPAPPPPEPPSQPNPAPPPQSSSRAAPARIRFDDSDDDDVYFANRERVRTHPPGLILNPLRMEAPADNPFAYEGATRYPLDVGTLEPPGLAEFLEQLRNGGGDGVGDGSEDGSGDEEEDGEEYTLHIWSGIPGDTTVEHMEMRQNQLEVLRLVCAVVGLDLRWVGEAERVWSLVDVEEEREREREGEGEEASREGRLGVRARVRRGLARIFGRGESQTMVEEWGIGGSGRSADVRSRRRRWEERATMQGREDIWVRGRGRWWTGAMAEAEAEGEDI